MTFLTAAENLKIGETHPSYLSSVSLNSDIGESISQSLSQGQPALSSHQLPGKLSSNQLQKLSCLYPERISEYFGPDGRCIADIRSSEMLQQLPFHSSKAVCTED